MLFKASGRRNSRGKIIQGSQSSSLSSCVSSPVSDPIIALAFLWSVPLLNGIMGGVSPIFFVFIIFLERLSTSLVKARFCVLVGGCFNRTDVL